MLRNWNFFKAYVFSEGKNGANSKKLYFFVNSTVHCDFVWLCDNAGSLSSHVKTLSTRVVTCYLSNDHHFSTTAATPLLLTAVSLEYRCNFFELFFVAMLQKSFFLLFLTFVFSKCIAVNQRCWKTFKNHQLNI